MRDVADGAYANLELPKLLRDKRNQRPRRRLRHRAGLRRDAPARPLRPDHRLGCRSPRRADRRQRARHPAARRAPAARHARGHPRRGRRDRRPGPEGQRRRCRRLRQRRHAPDQRAGPADVGRRRSCPRATRSRGWRPCTATPSGSSRRCGRRSSATARPPPRRSTPTSTALLVADNAPAKVSLVARPGLVDVDELVEAGAERSVLRPVGAVLAGGDPGGIAAVRDGRAAVQDEGSQLLVLALAAADVRDRAPARALARPVRRPGRQGGAARRAAPSGADSRSPTRSASTAPTWCGRPCSGAIDAGIEVKVGTGDGRELGEDEPGDLRPGARRRAVHRAGGAAPPPRGALASHDRGRRRPRRAAARAAGLGDRRHPARRPRRPTPRAARTSTRPGSSSATSSSGATTSSCVDARPLFTDAAGAPVAAPRRGALRPALAARARHRRDVPRPAAQGLTATAGRPATYDVPVQISPSILSADFANLEAELRRDRATPTGPTSTSWTTTSCPT